MQQHTINKHELFYLDSQQFQYAFTQGQQIEQVKRAPESKQSHTCTIEIYSESKCLFLVRYSVIMPNTTLIYDKTEQPLISILNIIKLRSFFAQLNALVQFVKLFDCQIAHPIGYMSSSYNYKERNIGKICCKYGAKLFFLRASTACFA